ncbi:MAG: dTDP-4-dehydrorhamnose reductase [Alphaproteobacteria bacterium]|nr:dTDP-4-dehydrorhamnose reductase [Alphaproteobacteria bacterium]
MTPLVVLGAGGQVGQAVVRAAQARGLDVRAHPRASLDISDRVALAAALPGAAVVVNCAAVTSVDDAARDPARAYAINAGAVAALALACRDAGVPLIHLSTDYVFDGTGARPWRESDAPSPVNVYGASKLAGEQAIPLIWPRHLILRISWVFGARGNNFVRSMLALARRRAVLRIVADQIGRPTPADACADAILDLAARCRDPAFDAWGLYHFAGSPPVSRYDFVRSILADRPSVRLEPIASADAGDIARRPLNAVLDCSLIERRFGIASPSWEASLPAVRRAIEADLDPR